MDEILRKSVFADYYQVALLDAEHWTEYPDIDADETGPAFTAAGVVVPASRESLVDVILGKGTDLQEGIQVGSGEIMVGNQGLMVGSALASDLSPVPWPTGRNIVRVFVDREGFAATRVVFILDPIGA